METTTENHVIIRRYNPTYLVYRGKDIAHSWTKSLAEATLFTADAAAAAVKEVELTGAVLIGRLG